MTIRDVAAEAGVSLGTVSNVLNSPETVAPSTRSRVQSAIEQLGYVRNATAYQLRAKRSLTVGLIVLDATAPFFNEISRGVEDAALAAGYVVILCNSDGIAEREDRYLRLLEEHRVAGILVATTLRSRRTHIDRLLTRGVKVVYLDRMVRHRRLCSVDFDDIRGGFLAGRHLAQLDYDRFAMINGPTRIRQFVDRRRGFRRALEEAGIASQQISELEVADVARDNELGQAAAAELLAGHPGRTAVFCATDELAIGFARQCMLSGVKIPDDVAIVGYNDIPYASTTTAGGLTTIRCPAYEIGHGGMTLLLEEIDADKSGRAHQHQLMTFAPELVVRGSTVAG